MKRALITGITGQDGTYLTEYLVGMGYQVYGLVRREARNAPGLQPLIGQLELLYGDIRDTASLEVAFYKAWPDEVYNLAAQVFVPTSWDIPSETFDMNVGGLVRLLRIVEHRKPDTRVYQASSSEMFGNFNGLCSEDTPFSPTSPYGASKMAAHRLCGIYRQRGLYAVGGILFNHESPRRGPEMVTRKITRTAAGWARGDRRKLALGNLQARRDWGYAGDYVKAMHAMLQSPKPEDFVVATGVSHSVGDFVQEVLNVLKESYGVEPFRSVEDAVDLDPRLLRTGEIHDLRGDASRAKVALGWKPEVDFRELVRMMVESDVRALAG